MLYGLTFDSKQDWDTWSNVLGRFGFSGHCCHRTANIAMLSFLVFVKMFRMLVAQVARHRSF